jgi:hypothetical protein
VTGLVSRINKHSSTEVAEQRPVRAGHVTVVRNLAVIIEALTSLDYVIHVTFLECSSKSLLMILAH